MAHNWTRNDDILTFYLCRYEDDNQINNESVIRYMGFSNDSSLKMRIQNFKHLDTGKGLANYANLTREVYEQYKDLNQNAHEQECIKILKNK